MPATSGTYATILLSPYTEPILVKVGSVDQDLTILHLLGPKYGDLRIPCMGGYLSAKWGFTPLPGKP